MNWLILYRLLALAALPFALLYHWYRSISRGRKSSFGERLGFLPLTAQKSLAGQPVIWLHAVSVGEVIASRPLLKGLQRRYPEHRLLLSVTTETGRGVADQDRLADVVIYFPFDTHFAVCRLLDAVKPQAIAIMETEIWPVFTFEAQRRNIPLLLANGRISARSFPRYQRFAWFFRPVLQCFSGLGMQSKADLERILAIGAPEERSKVLGNLKYDIPFSPVAGDERQQLRQGYRIPADLAVFCIGSTHPGEEEQLLAVYQELLKQFDHLLLVLVPRHPERTAEVETLVSGLGLPVVRRSALEQLSSCCRAGMVLLVDTVGELMTLYALSDLAYVGGSLVPTGGHNLLEPASRGIPIIFGPHMDNFQEITALTLEYGAGVQVTDRQGLLDAAADFLATPELRHVVGSNGLKLLRDSGGAVERHLAMLEEVMPQ
ncbi:MAG: 3-deoxy-D-manno-octulosonic acid transferase [Geobacteraceae bacterium]|nr:3-deoxy-D-manno-octulosonic acid transferase [Geobacteraceae bacterium]